MIDRLVTWVGVACAVTVVTLTLVNLYVYAHVVFR